MKLSSNNTSMEPQENHNPLGDPLADQNTEETSAKTENHESTTED